MKPRRSTGGAGDNLSASNFARINASISFLAQVLFEFKGGSGRLIGCQTQ